MTHTELQETLADYVAGRLAGGPRETLERHLEECEECADLADTWRSIVPGLRASGETAFEPHLEPSRLRKLAQADAESDREATVHIASCPSCALELEAWRDAALGKFGQIATAVQPRSRAWTGAWWSVAATLAATALLVFAWRGKQLPPPPRGEAPEWSGAPRMLVLEGAERGAASRVRLELEGDQPYALLGAQPVLPVSIAEGQSVRFSLAGDNGQEVWGTELRSEEVRARLRTQGAVLLLVPRRVLPTGPASLRAISNGELFWEAAFESAPQRQSPEATKAPQ